MPTVLWTNPSTESPFCSTSSNPDAVFEHTLLCRDSPVHPDCLLPGREPDHETQYPAGDSQDTG